MSNSINKIVSFNFKFVFYVSVIKKRLIYTITEKQLISIKTVTISKFPV